jgi:hypothetical protein
MRFAALAWTASGLGAAAVALAVADLLGAARLLGYVLGSGGALLGPLHAASPAWRYTVEVGDDALRVRRRDRLRLELPWPDVVRVVYSPSTATLFVDGGAPERSLLVPGLGAPASYDLERKPELCRAIVARVDPARVVEVASLEDFARSPA